MRPQIPSPPLRLALLGVSVAILLCLGAPEITTGLAYLCPFLVLIAFLLADRYPGAGLIKSRSRRALRRPQATRIRALSFAALGPRGGRLLASSLAGRAPPAPPFHLNPLQISS